MNIEFDPYAGYNDKRYQHYRHVETGRYETENVKSAKTGKRVKRVKEKVKVEFQEVKELKLDSIGQPIPTFDDADFTIVSNYLFDFWSAILGDSVVLTYMHLKRYAYNKKDYCYVDMETLSLKMGKSRPALKSYLETLEEHGFIAIFWRRDLQTKKDVSPLFKIRRSVPMLTKEMYEQLDPKLQKLHDKYMEHYKDVKFNSNLPSTHDILDDMLKTGHIMDQKKTEQVTFPLDSKGAELVEYILGTLSLRHQEEHRAMLSALMNRIAKPSFDSWIRNSAFIAVDEKTLKVIAPESFTAERIENHFSDIIRDVAEAELYMQPDFKLVAINARTYIEETKTGS